MQIIKRLSCQLLCNQKQIQQDFQLLIQHLSHLSQKYQLLINQVDTLKGQRYHKAQKYLHRSREENATEISKQQFRQYYHLDKLLDQLKNLLQNIKLKLKSAQEITNLVHKYDEIPQIKQLIRQTEDSLKTIDLHATLIKQRKFKYFDQGDAIICKCQEPYVIDSILRSVCKLEEEKIQSKRSQIMKSQQNQHKSQNAHQFNPLESLTEKQTKYLKQTFQNKDLKKVCFPLVDQDLDYFSQQYNVRYSLIQIKEQLFVLNHSFKPVRDMELFCGQKWQKLSYLSLVDCKISDDGFKIFLSKAKNFPDLKILFITQNQIDIQLEQVKDFYNFPNLQYVYFGNILLQLTELQSKHITEEKKQAFRRFLAQNNQILKRKLAIYI